MKFGLTTESLVKELQWMETNIYDANSIIEFYQDADQLLREELQLTESEYLKVTDKFNLKLLDVDRFIKVNEVKEVTNPRAFKRDNIPSDDGLLSNTIFGITQEDRAGTYGYIDLHGTFIHPTYYKAWVTIDKKVRDVVHGTKKVIINTKGEIVEDEEHGKTGIDVLIKNIDRIKFQNNKSMGRNLRVKMLEENKNRAFITKMIVIPPFYRDKNTAGSSRAVGLGGINKIYNNLIVASQALTATQDYGFDASDAMRGRVQEIVLQIYDWFCGNNNAGIAASDYGVGLSGKLGMLRRAGITKTANFASRMVITAAELKVERPEDLQVNFEYCAIPIASVIAQMRDFIIYHAKRFFENEFQGTNTYPYIKNGKVQYGTPKDPEVQFSDERIKKELMRFIHGYNNRLVPVTIEMEDSNDTIYMVFKGRTAKSELNQNPETIYHRHLTWLDVFYMAAKEASLNKHCMITRFPIDSYLNQVVMKFDISTTKQTEPMYFNNTYYPYYPKITNDLIGTNTSNMFIDTMVFSNLYCKGLGADQHNSIKVPPSSNTGMIIYLIAGKY